MNLTPDELRDLHGMLVAELAEAERDADPERAQRKARVLRRAIGNVEMRMKAMNPGPLGDVAHADLVSAARAFAHSQLGPLREREVVVRLAIGVDESHVFLLEKQAEQYVAIGGTVAADPGAFHALLDAAAGFVTTSLNSLDQEKRRAIKQALDSGDVLGLDIHAGGLVTLLVARGTEAVVVAMVQPQTETAGSSAAH